MARLRDSPQCMKRQFATRRIEQRIMPEVIINWIAVAAGLMATIGSLIGYIGSRGSVSTRSDDVAELRQALARERQASVEDRRKLERVVAAVKADLAATADRLSRVQATLVASTPERGRETITAELNHVRSVSDETAQKIRELTSTFDRSTDRISKLETVILADPQKAVAIPLIQRDLETIRAQVQRDVEGLRVENARTYDLMKWLIGLMALVSLSLVGTAVGHVFKRETSPADKPRKEEASTGEPPAAG